MTSKTQAQLDKMDALLQGKELQEKIIKTLRENISATIYKNRRFYK